MELKPGFKQTDLGPLPEEWEATALADFVRRDAPICYGILMPGAHWAGGVPVIKVRDIIDGRIDEANLLLTNPAIDQAYRRSRVRPGDVLITIRGTTGRVAIVPASLTAANITQDTARLRPSPECSPQFLHVVLHGGLVQSQVALHTIGLAVKGINIRDVKRLLVPHPRSRREQDAIAAALSDVDELLNGLDRLIAKKRDLKQAAMQQLLTGQTRLPGFEGEWETKRIGEFSDCVAGGTPSTDLGEYWGGPIRWMNSGELNLKMVREVEGRITERGLRESSTQVVPPRCVLIGLAGQGRTRGTVAMNLIELCTNQSIAVILPNSSFVPEYLYFNLDARYEELRSMSTGDGGRGGLNLRIIRSIEVPFPSPAEQSAIASVLSDIDAEIEALERRRAKTADLKQAMMQELLTGRIRLIEREVVAPQAKSAPSNAKGHNWAINEAVVIAALVKLFGSERYPLGRKRYTKLAYLLHRHVERRAEGYLKKAAGPYNPKTKYAGPEKIAIENGYVRAHKAGKYEGFVAGENFAKAEAYFDKWYGADVLKWIGQFRFSTNDDLELLTTVDMAVDELWKTGGRIDVEAVKTIIRNDPEWRAKLERPLFSDPNIAEAIGRCHRLFALS